jgi:hypothetical protein
MKESLATETKFNCRDKVTKKEIDDLPHASEQFKFMLTVYHIENSSLERTANESSMTIDNTKYILNKFTKQIIQRRLVMNDIIKKWPEDPNAPDSTKVNILNTPEACSDFEKKFKYAITKLDSNLVAKRAQISLNNIGNNDWLRERIEGMRQAKEIIVQSMEAYDLLTPEERAKYE